MSHVEELTLYIHILGGSSIISGTYLDNEILIHMPRLYTFTFYFASENAIDDSVIHLKLWDEDPFEYEFFVRLQTAFPFLKSLSIWNIQPPFFRSHEYHLRDKDWCSIVEYPHLISLGLNEVSSYYVEHFLNEKQKHIYLV